MQFIFHFSLFKITNTHFKIANTHFKISNVQFKITNTHFKTIYSQFRITNSQFKITNSQFKITNSQFKITDSQFKITDSQFKIANSQFKTTNSQFKITNSQFNFTDFSKGFDRVDHNVLMANLQKLNVHPALSNWVSAFLSNRMQATRIAGVLSDWKSPNGGIPQGTKLGVILFSVMTNELLVDWNLRTKFVDDTTALEIIPRNSTSLMNIVAENVNEFAEKNRMKLNPRKCKEMVIDPLEYNTTVLRPITIGNTTIEKVKKYKLLGVILTADLKWKEHIAYIYGKACKRLYSLRVLRKAGVEEKNMLKVYLAIIRPILEYAVPVWQAIPEYLSQKIESVQKRALKIIKPGEESYEELLRVFNVEKLQPRREKLCRQYMGKIKSPNHQLNTLIPQQVDREHEYNLRNDNNRNFYLFNNRPYCRTKLCGDFFTFKYY